MASRPRSSLATATGLPTPGGSGALGGTGRRKSGLASPGSSPTKTSMRAAQNDDIATRMAELQSAMRVKDPASFQSASGRRSALGGLAVGTTDDDEVEMLQPLSEQSPPEFISPRPIRRIPSTASALKRTSQSGLRSVNKRDSEGGTPTSTPGPAASFVRPGSSLSSSSYMSAHGQTEGHARSPLPADMPQTPARRTGGAPGLTPGSIGLARTASTISSTSSFSTAPSSLHHLQASRAGDDGLPQVGDQVKAVGMEGTLRYVGEVQGKPRTWVGIELTGEYVGKGKNNGTVMGKQYFACPADCGIFAQLSKVEVVSSRATVDASPPSSNGLTRSRPPSSLSNAGSQYGVTPMKLPRRSGAAIAPSTTARNATTHSTQASQLATSRITAGSRASSYLNLTAKQLQERKAQTGSPAQQSAVRSPRKSTILASSTASTATTGGPTPKPIRTARPSIGNTAPSAVTTRKSLGGPATPGPASSIRRPPSSLRSRTSEVPSVPPLPANLGYEAAPAPTPAKAHSFTARPTTPAGRPSSRLSQTGSVARSVSRASSRASLLSGPPSRLGHRNETGSDDEQPANSQAHIRALQEAKEDLSKMTHEAEQAKLELLELTAEYKDEQKRVKSLQREVDELKRRAASSRVDGASAVDELQLEREKHVQELAKYRSELEDARAEITQSKDGKSAMEAELAQGHDLLARIQNERDAAAREAQSLASQVDELQKAGRSMVDLYEDKCRNLEDDFQNTHETLQIREQQLHDLREEVARQQALIEAKDQTARETNNTDALLAASMSASRGMVSQESATAIENDNLRAEVQHLKKRINNLEEQADEVRADFETELEKEKSKRRETSEASDKAKRELKDLKEKVDAMKAEKEKIEERVHELEVALSQSKHTLESERAELETLRSEQQQNASSGARNDELAHLRSALTVAQHERKEREREVQKLTSDLASMQEELKLMEEIRDEGKIEDPASSAGLSTMEGALKVKDAEIKRLNEKLEQALNTRLPKISTAPTDTDTQHPTLQAAFSASGTDQHLSPHDKSTAMSPNQSPLSAASSSGRRKRDSNTSVRSVASFSSLTSLNSNYRRASLKDEASMRKDEIEGLKILLKQAEADNSKLREENEVLQQEARSLKEGQKALESTVNSLAEQIEAQQPGKGNQAMSPRPNLPPKTSSQELLEAEVKELKEAVQKLERKYHKDCEALNSEVAQLELLVEAKIFREGELESMLEDARSALTAASKARNASRPDGDGPGAGSLIDSPRRGKSTIKPVRSSVSSMASTKVSQTSTSEDASGRRSASQYSEEDYDDNLCELCKGEHNVKDCPIFGDSATGGEPVQKRLPNPDTDEPWCDDCEEHGHDLANCPLADEVF